MRKKKSEGEKKVWKKREEKKIEKTQLKNTPT